MQKWWLLGVAVVGIGFAVLLIPRPDTGSDLAPPAAPAPSEAAPDAEPAERVRPGRPAPEDMRPGPSPEAAKAIAERNKPETVAAKGLAAPWGGIRYQLAKEGSDEAKQLSEKIAVHQSAFAKHIRTPEGPLDDLIAAAAPVVEELKASRFGADTNIATAIGRYEAAVASWAETKQNLPAEE